MQNTNTTSGNAYEKTSHSEKGMKVEQTLQKEQLEQELERLRDDISQLGSSLKTIAGNAASIAVDTLKDRFDSASGDVQSRLSTSRATAQRQVEEHPVTTIVIAAGLGFLLGQWMRR